MRTVDRLGLVALAAVTALGAWLRLQALGQAYEPDEFANLHHGYSLWQVIVDHESGVNPPLLRALFNVPLDETGTLVWGRRFGWACSVATIPLLALLVRRATGSMAAALAAAALLATMPYAVHMGGRYRSYAAFGATLTAHLVLLDAWIRAPRPAPRALEAGLVGTAILLPQWNYFGVPILLALGGASLAWAPLRGLFVRYVPAGLLAAPLAIVIAGVTSARVAHEGPLDALLRQLLAWDASTDHKRVANLYRAAPWLEPDDKAFGLGAAVTVVWLVVALLGWRRLSTTSRVLALGVVAVLAAVLAFSTIQLVRPPTTLFLAAFALPLMASAAALPRAGWARALASLALVVSVGVWFPWNLRKLFDHPVYEGPRTFAATWRTWDEARAGREVVTYPQYTAVALCFYLTGDHLGWVDQQPGRKGPGGGFLHEGTAFRSITGWNPTDPPHGLVVAFRQPPEGFGAGCTRLQDAWNFHVWDCP